MKNFLQQINSYIKEALNAGKYLYNGFSVTFDHLRRRPVTVQYPYEKLIPSERYRGRIHYEFDKCIACEVCVRVCPINLPVVDWVMNKETKKKELRNYSIDFGVCIFCGNCVEYCPTNCLSMTEEYELATFDSNKGKLLYRGYSIEELSKKSSFLETAYLLIWGELPTAIQLRDFEQEVQMHRRLSFRVRDMMKCFPATGHPMDALQSSAASLGLFYSRRAIDDPNYIYNAVIRLIAKIPTMIAAFQLIRKGQDPIQPRDDLTYSSNFLYMLTEKEQDPIAAKVFDRCLILHAEHSLNASTFSARVTASTLTDPYAVIASAVGTLAGPLHGGANEDVIAMLEEIKTPENAASFLDNAIKNKTKIMGFGHREYKVKDP
ncbi:NADH-quinone oxidoreductase subunit NuoI, partial [Prochlorococcus sp. AH-736-N10]|nr:NADH-quinone oxidoreductase subunit NuoI [Prochlorococcus sp. AH-736-N10]